MNCRAFVAAAVFLTSLGGPSVATANVFGARPSFDANTQISNCNSILELGQRVDAAQSLQVTEVTTDLVRDIQERCAEANPEDGCALTNPATLGDLERIVLRLFLHASCDDVFAYEPTSCSGEPTVQQSQNRGLFKRDASPPYCVDNGDMHWATRLPVLSTDIGRVRSFHFGGGTSATADAGTDTPGDGTAFAPVLGVSTASNANALTVLLDARITEDELGLGSRSEATFGAYLLNPTLRAQSLYFNAAIYPWRNQERNRVIGVNLRVVAQRLAFRLPRPGSDEPTSFTGALIAPTLSGAALSTGLGSAENELTLGVQVGVTARLFAFAGTAPSVSDQRLLFRRGLEKRRPGVWAAGLDVTVFMQYQSVLPYMRLTVLDGPDHAPDSLVGAQLIFGMDVLAAVPLTRAQP